MKEQEMPMSAIIPIEKCITKDGVGIVSEIVGNSEEAVNQTVEFLNSITMGHQMGKTEKVDSSKGHTFGFTNWNSSWNPEGPKPNWVVPKNPSKN
jgi:hypothetical protein